LIGWKAIETGEENAEALEFTPATARADIYSAKISRKRQAHPA